MQERSMERLLKMKKTILLFLVSIDQTVKVKSIYHGVTLSYTEEFTE
jgi:hypothetical protein